MARMFRLLAVLEPFCHFFSWLLQIWMTEVQQFFQGTSGFLDLFDLGSHPASGFPRIRSTFLGGSYIQEYGHF